MIDKTVQNLAGTARTHAMKIRLTPAEDATIQRKAEEAGLSCAEFVRRATLGAKFAAPRRVRIAGMSERSRVAGLMGHCRRMLEEAGLVRYVLYGPSTVFLMEVQFRPGDQVKIEAVRGNDHAYAEVVVPEAPKVLSVTPEKIYVRQYEDIYPCISFAVRLEDRPGTDDYFRIGMGSDVRQTFHFRDEAGVTLRPDTTLFYGRDFRPEIGRDPILNDGYTFENFENDFFADFNATNTARIFSDRLFSGSECTVKPFADSSEFTPRFYNWTAYAPDGEICSSSGFEADPTAVVKVMAISRMHYAYYKALNNGEVFGFDTNPIVEPVALPSNVEGGLGFVGIASTASVRLEMPRVTEKNIHWTPMY